MEARKERIMRMVTLGELAHSGKWTACTKTGEPVDKEEATHVACVECGKVYQWNQGAWIAKHEATHEQTPETGDERTKVLQEALGHLEELTKRIEGVLREDERKRTA